MLPKIGALLLFIAAAASGQSTVELAGRKLK
jgi:hypothetical protein